MTAFMRRLEARRKALVLRSGRQRMQLLVQLAPGARVLATADRVAATVRAHPALAALMAGSLALAGRTSLWRWALRAVPIYALLRRG